MKTRSWVRYGLSLLIAMASFGFSDRFFTAEGGQSDAKFVLMRFEDIGPGGQYDSPEQLGKLRTVFEYLQQQKISYQIGVIPRWVNYLQDAPAYDRSLDNKDDPYIRAFVKVLQNAEQGGGVIGMHGYTHQVGQAPRKDGHQESGIGNEFNIAGIEETSTPAFAQQRIQAGLAIMKQADIMPRFWESPHYHTAVSQADVFRTYFGIIYENEPNKAGQPGISYQPSRNSGYGADTLGAAYVPTPFSYIPYNKDEKLIVNQLGNSKRLPSFFYHPFLEFKHLAPVLNEEGNPVIRDGLPEYRYLDKDKSNLQKLVADVRRKGYTFYSLLDAVPFTPSQSIRFRMGKENFVRIGDVDGDGQADLVTVDPQAGGIFVIKGSFNGMRSDPQQASELWLNVAIGKGDQVALFDYDNDGKNDLWILRASGKVEAYRSTGTAFAPAKSWKGFGALDWIDVYPVRLADGSWVVTGVSKSKSELQGLYYKNGELKATVPLKIRSISDKKWLISRAGGAKASEHLWIPKIASGTIIDLDFDAASMRWNVDRLQLQVPEDDGELRLGDFNGDGKEDILYWNSTERKATVLMQDENGSYRVVSRFGPWGKEGSRLIVKDFDGNGKSDLGLISGDGVLDVALSFQTLH